MLITKKERDCNMIDDFLKKQFEFYIEFRESVSRSRDNVSDQVLEAIEKINNVAKSPQEFATKYKAFLLLEEIIKELCENYLIEAHKQEMSKEKMAVVWGKIKKERESLAQQDE